MADQAEVFAVSAESSSVHFEANRVKSVESRESAGAAVRIIKDGRVSLSSTSNVRDLQEPGPLLHSALETAPFSAVAHFDLPGPGDYPQVPSYDPGVESLGPEQLVQLGQQVVDAVRSGREAVQMEGRVSTGVSIVTLANSAGVQLEYRKSFCSLGFQGTVVRGEDMLFVSESLSSTGPIPNPTPVVDGLVRKLEWARETAQAKTRTMPVVFTPTAVAGLLIAPLAGGLSGRSVLLGTSPLGDKLGKQVVDPRFSLLDDPTIPYVGGSRVSDDEGVPSQRLSLIEDGQVAHFYYDLQTAGQAGVRSTGSGERGLSSLPSPGTSVLVVGCGDASWDALVEEVGDGLVVDQLLGAGQGNTLAGDFSANVLLGYRVEAGRIVGRVKDTMVTGNVYRILNQLVGIGSEGRWLGGGLYTPAIACAGVGVASAAPR